MSTSTSQQDLAKLINEVQTERTRLAKVEAQLKSAKEVAKIARRRRKEAKQAARKAKKQVKQAKQEVTEVKQSLFAAEKRLATAQRSRARSAKATVTGRHVVSRAKATAPVNPASARRAMVQRSKRRDSGRSSAGKPPVAPQPESVLAPRDLQPMEPPTSPSPVETLG